MFNSSFYEIIKTHNQIINMINCTLRELEKDVASYVENNPAVVLYSYEPLDVDNNHYFTFDYPNIIFALLPFKAIISYNEIIEKLDGKFNNSLFIEQTIANLILDRINSQ